MGPVLVGPPLSFYELAIVFLCYLPSGVHTPFSHVARAAALFTNAVSAQHTWDPNISFVVLFPCHLEEMFGIDRFNINISRMHGCKFICLDSILSLTIHSEFNTWYATC